MSINTEESLAFVNLNCLNCGASLKITQSIFEFACQYCGATQIVERAGGIVALKFFSDKIDRVQATVDQTAAELKLQRLKGELDELRKRRAGLEEALQQYKSKINPVAVTALIGTFFPFFLITAYTNSVLPIVLGGVVVFIIFTAWRMFIQRLDTHYARGAKPLSDREIEIREKIVELERITGF